MKQKPYRQRKTQSIIGKVFVVVSVLALFGLLLMFYIAYRNNALPFELPAFFVRVMDSVENGTAETPSTDMVQIQPQGREVRELLAEIPDLPQDQQSELTSIYVNEKLIEAILEQATDRFDENELFASLSAQQTLHVTVLEGALTKYGVEAASESADISPLTNLSLTCEVLLIQERAVIERYTATSETVTDDDLRALFDARIRQSELGRIQQLEACTN